MRAGAVVVLGFAVMGLPAGILWHAVAPSAADVGHEPELAMVADARFGLVAVVAGVLTGLLAAWARRRDGAALVVGAAVGGLAASLVQLGVGLLLGAPALLSKPMLLVWSVGSLIALVAVGLTFGLVDRGPEGEPGA